MTRKKRVDRRSL